MHHVVIHNALNMIRDAIGASCHPTTHIYVSMVVYTDIAETLDIPEGSTITQLFGKPLAVLPFLVGTQFALVKEIPAPIAEPCEFCGRPASEHEAQQIPGATFCILKD